MTEEKKTPQESTLPAGAESGEASTLEDSFASGFHWFPWLSGLYTKTFFWSPWSASRAEASAPEEPEASSAGFWPWWFQRENLCLDVDGRYPQMTASGTLYSGLTMWVHWIANLTAAGSNTWTGTIWYKDGNTAALPQTNVEIKVVSSWLPSQRRATVTFSGGGAPHRVRTFRYRSRYFHKVEFEFDTVEGTSAVTSIDTCDHPNRPATISCENLSIETVYRRAGLDVSKSGGDGSVPIAGAGVDAMWTDMEMHDAMQTYWSRFADKAQWSLWTFFAWQHAPVPAQGITPYNLGGIMFDDIGPNHRQGTAIFSGSFIKDAPPGDADPVDWVKRTKFWTAVHEMGHAFNLAHSWQKSHPPSWGTPWIPMANEPEARSFMNYPDNVAGGETAFFADFEFRFSDTELLFMRHAPERFVQMGNADWFDNHAFQLAAVSPEPKLALELRVHRDADYFEFLEPISVELKLTNISDEPQLVDDTILGDAERLTVILKKNGKAARQSAPFARRCFKSKKQALDPGKSIYASLDVSNGLNGSDLAEPGVYLAQVALHLGEEDVISNPLRIRVAPPRDYDEEYVAQDFFSEDVSRILAFNGSVFLERGNDTLSEVVERLPGRRVARHARLALASPKTLNFKSLVLGEGTSPVTSVQDDGGRFRVRKVSAARATEARKQLAAALTDDTHEAVETLGNIRYKEWVDSYSRFLADQGDPAASAQCEKNLYRTLEKRGVLGSVLDEIAKRQKGYASKAPAKKKAARKRPRKRAK